MKLKDNKDVSTKTNSFKYLFLREYAKLTLTSVEIQSSWLAGIEAMFPFGTPWKHKETLSFSDVFQGVPKGNTDSLWVRG